MMQRMGLNVMKNWLSVHDWPAKQPYISPVSRGRSDEDPLPEFRVGVSVHKWAKSTRRARPVRLQTVAPRGATQLHQKMKKPFGMSS